MSELTLLILRLAFLVVLWGFVFAVIIALRSDLFGQRVRRQAKEAAVVAIPTPPAAPQAPAPLTPRTPTPARTPSGTGHTIATPATASRLVITSGSKAGLELELDGQPLTIGRSSDSGLVIRDDYTSTHHARILVLHDAWVIQDLDSTNGTFLDGQKVQSATQIPLNTAVKIGTTSFELRR